MVSGWPILVDRFCRYLSTIVCLYLFIDIVGPLTPMPKRSTAYWYSQTTLQDTLPILNTTADTIVELLEKRVFCYLSVPEQIHTDQGTRFESRLMTELLFRTTSRPTG